MVINNIKIFSILILYVFMFATVERVYANESLNNQLIEASNNGNLAEVKSLVKQGADVNYKDDIGRSAIYVGCWRLDIVKFLIDAGADVNTRYDSNTILMEASYNGDISIVRYIIKQGGDIHLKNHRGTTALLEATRGGYLDIIEFLVNQGADVNTADHNYFTPLKWTITESGDMDTIRYLVKSGADINYKGDLDGTALMYASRVGNLTIVRFLVEQGADVNIVGRNNMETLTSKKLEGYDKNKYTALIAAELEGQTAVIEYLKSKGAK